VNASVERPTASAPAARAGSTSLPDFFVIGAFMSGTTALHHLLGQHPEIFVPSLKEPSFFAYMDVQSDCAVPPGSITTWGEYAALYRDCRPAWVAGDVSPAYMTIPRSADRIRRHASGARLIAVLRNPIDRAYADYSMYVQLGRETLDFMSALRQLDWRSDRGEPTGDYISSGRYGTQLWRYYELFPKEQIHVVLFEDFVGHQASALADIFAFLGVDSEFKPGPIENANPTGLPPNRLVSPDRFAARLYRHVHPSRDRSRLRRPRTLAAELIARSFARPPMSAEAREYLVTVLWDEIALTERLTGRSLSHWLES
jgi:hypothetical protein